MDFGAKGDKSDIAPYVDWVIHDRILPRSGRTLIREYIHRNAATLTPRELDILKAWAASYVGLYEIQQITEGTGVEMKSLLDGEVFFVHDVAASNQLSQWDVLLARIVLGRRGNELAGMASVVPRRQVDALRTWMEEDRKASGSFPCPRYLKQNWPAVRRRMFDISQEWASSLILQNTDGEDLLISTAVYRVIDRQALTAALDARPDIVRESDEHYTWLKGSKEHSEGSTVLGKFIVRAAQLSVECNSKERLARAKSVLAAAAGPAVDHVRDTFTTQSELKRQMHDAPAAPPGTSIPPEEANRIIAEYQERHYAQWPDTKLPALHGKTPRQAVKTAAGRRQVEALLRDFENGEARKRKAGGPAYDFSRIRSNLGL